MDRQSGPVQKINFHRRLRYIIFVTLKIIFSKTGQQRNRAKQAGRRDSVSKRTANILYIPDIAYLILLEYYNFLKR